MRLSLVFATVLAMTDRRLPVTVLSGFLGALLASGVFVLLKGVLVDRVLAPNFPITRFITWGDVWLSSGAVFLIGVALAAIAS